jgi:exopolyphosphatase/guanosine-5'-triphosphate,3'-diphosphate pyrophosphatase
VDELRPTRAALRQGVIFDLHQRLRAAREPDLPGWREETIAELQRRFQVDLRQAARVQALSLSLYEQLSQDGDVHQADVPDHGAQEARLELAWAAALHEIGLCISHHDHHRHSAYLLAHIDAPGFSQSQQRRMADIVLAQRGGLRKVEAALADPVRRLQILALRLAVLLCHGRGDLGGQPLKLMRRDRMVRLSLQADWADRHPRAVYLLHEEMRAWARVDELNLELH